MWTGQLKSSHIEALVYSPDGQTLYSRDRLGMVGAWDLATHNYTELFCGSERGVGYLVPTADGKQLFASDESMVILWDVETKTKTQWQQNLEEPALDLQPTTTGNYWYSLDFITSTLQRSKAGSLTFKPCKGEFAQNVYDFAISPNDQWISTYTSDDERSAVHVAKLNQSKSWMTFSPLDWPAPNPTLSTDSELFTYCKRGGVEVHHLPTKSLYAKFKISQIVPQVLAFHPSGRFLAVGGSSARLSIYELPSGQVHSRYYIPTGSVNIVQFSPDGTTLAVAGSRRSFAVLDLDF